MLVPIYAAGRLIRYADAEVILANRFHFRLIVSKKARKRVIPLPHQIKVAHLRLPDTLDVRPASRLGMAFEQQLSTGHVYALRGVRGSQ